MDWGRSNPLALVTVRDFHRRHQHRIIFTKREIIESHILKQAVEKRKRLAVDDGTVCAPIPFVFA